MFKKSLYFHAARIGAILLILLSAFGVMPAYAARDRTPPTRPTNLRVTATTAYNVSLAWDPSTDNSGVFSYKVHASNGSNYTVSQSQTSFTFFLIPDNTYSFYVYAVDGSGNRSQRSNTVSATLPADTTPPSAPVLSVVDVNPTGVSLEWTASTDDGPYLFYQVFVDGEPSVDAGTSRSAVVQGLNPETSYVFTVKARDLYGGNVSEPSNAVQVTTGAQDPNDGEPPTSSTNLDAWDLGCGEVWLFWTESFDNQTPQSAIVYEIYVKGTLDHTLIGADYDYPSLISVNSYSSHHPKSGIFAGSKIGNTIMEKLSSVVQKLDDFFRISEYPADPAFRHLHPMVYDEAGISWKTIFEPDFTQHFNGLILKGSEQIHTVFCAVLSTPQVLMDLLDQAQPGDLFFTHHPIDFEMGDPRGARGRGPLPIEEDLLQALIHRELSVYACHAPLDHNRVISTSIAMEEALGTTFQHGIYPWENYYNGSLCTIPPTSTQALIETLIQIFKIPYVDFAGKSHERIEWIAIIPGGGDKVELIQEAEAAGAQALVTGEVRSMRGDAYGIAKYEKMMAYLPQTSLSLLGVSHAASEHLVMETHMLPWFEQNCQVQARTIEMEKWWR